MHSLQLNLWIVLAAGVAKFLLGGLWYSPVLFSKQWAKLTGIKESSMKSGAGKAMGIEFFLGLLMAFVLAHAIRYSGAQGIGEGIVCAFWNWLGFVAAFGFTSVNFEKRPLKLFYINQGFQLLSMLLMGTILVLWV